MEFKEPLLICHNSKHLFYNSDLTDPVIQIQNGYLVPALGRRDWDGHIYVSGATGCGKTYIIKKIVENDKLGRHCILFTDLKKSDPSLAGLKYTRYDETDKKADSEWLRNNQANKIMIFDDVQFNKDLIDYRDHMLEKGRHMNTIVVCVNHKLRDYRNTKVPLNESRFVICFPCSNRGACAQFLQTELELDKHKTQHILDTIAKEGRHMIIHRFHPNLISGTKTIFRV